MDGLDIQVILLYSGDRMNYTEEDMKSFGFVVRK